MNIYIPIVPIAIGLVIYLVIGLLLFVPLVYWQRRFLSDYRSPYRRPVFEGIRIFKGLIASSLFWPVMIGYYAYTEIRYRKKGYL